MDLFHLFCPPFHIVLRCKKKSIVFYVKVMSLTDFVHSCDRTGRKQMKRKAHAIDSFLVRTKSYDSNLLTKIVLTIVYNSFEQILSLGITEYLCLVRHNEQNKAW